MYAKYDTTGNFEQFLILGNFKESFETVEVGYFELFL